MKRTSNRIRNRLVILSFSEESRRLPYSYVMRFFAMLRMTTSNGQPVTRILSSLLSLLLTFSPAAYPVASVDYLIGTLGNAFSGRIEGGAALFEIESGRIGTEFAEPEKDNHPLFEMAGNIAKISANAGTNAYFVIDGTGVGEILGKTKVKASVRLIKFNDRWDEVSGGFRSKDGEDGKVEIVVEPGYNRDSDGDDLIISVDVIDKKIQIQRVTGVGNKKLALTTTIEGSHTAYSSTEGMIDGKYNNYDEIITRDEGGLLWRTSASGIRSGDVVATTTYYGYDQLTGELNYTYTYGYSNGALNNYVEFLKYDVDGRPSENRRTGLVGGDTYGDGDLVIEDDDYVSTNIYEKATLASVHVEGQINGRRSNYNRDFTYDSLGRVVETTYSAFDAEHITASQWDDYVIVNGAVYGGEKPEDKYSEITRYNRDGNVASVRRFGAIDGYRDSYAETYTYTKRGQIKDVLTNGTYRGNTYTNLKTTNIIVKENTMSIGAALSDINSGRTLASITVGLINGTKSDVVTRYRYDNDRIVDTEMPFAVVNRVGRQITTFTRGIRDATYYGDGEKATAENYDLQDIVMLSGLFPGLDVGRDRALTTYERELIKSKKIRGGSVTLKDKLNEDHAIQFDGITSDTSLVTYSKYNETIGQVVKTQTGVKVGDVIKGGMINATENYYSTLYEYDTDDPEGLGRELKTATRGIRGGRIYGLLDLNHTVDNLDWVGGIGGIGKVDEIADYIETNTYYTFDDANAVIHLFRLKSTHSQGWTDGEVNDFTKKLDYDNDGVGVTWDGGVLKSEVGTALNKVKGDGRVVRTITGGMVSARCYGNTCDAKEARNFDLTDPKNDFHFGFVREDGEEEIPDPTVDIYQEISSYDSQGRVVFAKNLGLVNSAKDNYRIDYFYETGAMAGRQQKSVINSRAIGEGNAIVSASIRINYVEETEYDDEDEEDLNEDGTVGPLGRGLRTSTKVTGYDGGAYNNYVQLFKYQETTGANTFASIAGRMNEVRYRGMRSGTVSGYFKSVTEELTLNTSLNDLFRVVTLENLNGWVEGADFVQRLVYADINDADARAGQQKWVDTEGTSASASNDYRTLYSYDSLGRQTSRRIEGVHKYSKLKIVDKPLENAPDASDVEYDSNSRDGKEDGYGIVGGMFSKSNEIMEYNNNGSLAFISIFDGYSERIEESMVLSGEDNYKRMFLYMDELSNENEFFGQDTGYLYKANVGYLAPIVGGSAYFGADQVANGETTNLKDNPCIGENCNYKVNYTYNRKGQRLTQYTFGYQNVDTTISKFKDNGSNKGEGISVKKDLYTTTFGYDQYGRTAKTSYNKGDWIRGAEYGIAPEKNGKKSGQDREYVTTYKYDDLGFQTSQQSIGYRDGAYDNFTRANLTEHTTKSGRMFANYWGRAIASRTVGIQAGKNLQEDGDFEGELKVAPEAMSVIFDGYDDGRDPLVNECGDDNGDACQSRSYYFKTKVVQIGDKYEEVGDSFTVKLDIDEDGISGEADVEDEVRTYEIVDSEGMEGYRDDDGDGKYEINLKYELARRIFDSITKVIANPAEGDEDFTYGDMYAGPRPCVRQSDGTLNCAH